MPHRSRMFAVLVVAVVIWFGTDQMRWPETIGMAIEVIRSSPSLTEAQRRDILYNNGARFLRLSPDRGRGF